MTRRTADRPIAVLISGRGSNLRALLEGCGAPDRPYRIVHVLSDNSNAAGLDIAAAANVPTTVVAASAFADRKAFEGSLATAIEACAPALVALAGFMRILSAEFVDRFAGRLLNIHPSLLPRYPGLDTHRRVLAAGDREHGATVHFVTAQLDGGPRVVQSRVEVYPHDTEATLAERVLAREHEIYPLAVGWHAAGRLEYRDDRAWFDGQPLGAPIRYDGRQVSRSR